MVWSHYQGLEGNVSVLRQLLGQFDVHELGRGWRHGSVTLVLPGSLVWGGGGEG